MTLDQFNDLAQGLSALASIIAMLVGGYWIYWKFDLQKEKEPRLEFDLSAEFLGVQDGKWIVEVSASLKNKGRVRHPVQNATMNIRYLTADDQVEEAKDPRLYRQVKFPHNIGRRPVWWNSYVDPGLEARNSYLTWVPGEATFVLLLCEFEYGEDKDPWPAQRVLKVPPRPNQGHCKASETTRQKEGPVGRHDPQG